MEEMEILLLVDYQVLVRKGRLVKMFTIKFWKDYYNEKGEYREIINYRKEKNVAISHAEKLVKELGYERSIVTKTGYGKVFATFGW